MLENDVNEKCADSIIGDIENSLKKESNIDSILAAVYQKVILKLGEPILLHYRKISQRLPFLSVRQVSERQRRLQRLLPNLNWKNMQGLHLLHQILIELQRLNSSIPMLLLYPVR